MCVCVCAFHIPQGTPWRSGAHRTGGDHHPGWKLPQPRLRWREAHVACAATTCRAPPPAPLHSSRLWRAKGTPTHPPREQRAHPFPSAPRLVGCGWSRCTSTTPAHRGGAGEGGRRLARAPRAQGSVPPPPHQVHRFGLSPRAANVHVVAVGSLPVRAPCPASISSSSVAHNIRDEWRLWMRTRSRQSIEFRCMAE